MPEALAIVFVFVVSVAIYFFAWMRSRDPALANASEELQRLRHHHAWLQQRLELAVREQWDREMIASLTEELRETSRQLALVTEPAPAR